MSIENNEKTKIISFMILRFSWSINSIQISINFYHNEVTIVLSQYEVTIVLAVVKTKIIATLH